MPRPRMIQGRQQRRTVILAERQAEALRELARTQQTTESDILRRLIDHAARCNLPRNPNVD